MGSYIEHVLGRDERVLATAKVTGWIYLGPALITIASVGFLFPILLIPYLVRATTELAVTNKRVIAKTGVIGRRTVEQRIQKIESIRVDQGIFGRMLDYGSIRVHGTGGATTPIPNVSNPFEFKRAVERIIDEYEESTAADRRV